MQGFEVWFCFFEMWEVGVMGEEVEIFIPHAFLDVNEFKIVECRISVCRFNSGNKICHTFTPVLRRYILLDQPVNFVLISSDIGVI